ncbi:MAG: DUF488 domain-containing protein [Actinomycetota bacterium]|nr:DUF488 domain-containing protein [Actinomycetota bacterium]
MGQPSPSPIQHQHPGARGARRLVTIGVYDWDVQSWSRALADADVRVVWDVRQRRGVRGPRYAWANSLRLQRTLAEAGIAYAHHKELAPTTALRHLQYAEDARQGVGKRSRVVLAEEYRRRYTHEILDRVPIAPLLAQLPTGGACALLCVERDPEACHRSLLAERIAGKGESEVAIAHLRP